MADRMMDPRGAPGPRPGMPPAGRSPVEENRSILNPTDAAVMQQRGQVQQGMTAGQILENVFHVRWEDPAEKLFENAKKLVQNRTATGKAGNIAKDTGPAPGAPPGSMPGRSPGGTPGGQPGGSPGQSSGGNPLEMLMSRLGG